MTKNTNVRWCQNMLGVQKELYVREGSDHGYISEENYLNWHGAFECSINKTRKV